MLQIISNSNLCTAKKKKMKNKTKQNKHKLNQSTPEKKIAYIVLVKSSVRISQ